MKPAEAQIEGGHGARAPLFYRLLPDHTIEPVFDMADWARAFETSNRRVARTEVGPVAVSTVFLAVDHGLWGNEPILFETMIFDRNERAFEFCARYRTWDEAASDHQEVVEKLRALAKGRSDDELLAILAAGWDGGDDG